MSSTSLKNSLLKTLCRLLKKISGQVSYWVVIAYLFLGATFSQAQPAPPASHSFSSSEIVLHAAPDESSAIVGLSKHGEAFSPIAESLSAEGARWYLIKTNAGVVGWMKKTDRDESKELEKFFKSLPVEPASSEALNISPAPSAADPSDAIKVPVQMTGASVIVPVTLNRRLKAFLALDTGATTTMISHRVAKRLGLRTDGPRVVATTVTGHVSIPLARLGSIKVGDAEVYNLSVTVHDLSPATRVDGLLGLDFLKRFHVSIDSRNQLLILAPR
ncbi:MAG: retroviral-like aspartic protease family protein [Candidatus Binatia bacterium]